MGTKWEKSGSIERDNNDIRAGGAKAYFYVGGTTTPLVVFEDADEATPHDNPVLATASGRWPLVFIPFATSYDVKVTTSAGSQLYYYTEIPNPNPVTAAEDTVDATQLIQTGDVIWTPKTGTRSGFVRLNGRTIGNAVSGASERANDDTEDLFTFLWNIADTQAPVSSGRGATAAADFAAGKTITLLDGRSSLLGGLDDMGNTAASRFTSVTFANGDATTVGSVAGANTTTLSEGQLAAHTHTFSATTGSGGGHSHTYSGTTGADGAHNHTVTDPTHTHSSGSYYLGSATGNVQSGPDFIVATGVASGLAISPSSTGISLAAASAHTHTYSGTTSTQAAHTHSVSGTSGSTGSGSAVPITQRTILGTFYQKL